MRRALVVLGTALLMALGMTASPAAADGHFSVTYRTAVSGDNVAEACRASENVIVADVTMGAEEFSMPLSEPGQMTLGGCVSTMVRQQLTTAAYVANCRALEEFFAMGNDSGRPYPYAFYGNPNYLANNRADCVRLLRGFHTGMLQPGPA